MGKINLDIPMQHSLQNHSRLRLVVKKMILQKTIIAVALQSWLFVARSHLYHVYRIYYEDCCICTNFSHTAHTLLTVLGFSADRFVTTERNYRFPICVSLLSNSINSTVRGFIYTVPRTAQPFTSVPISEHYYCPIGGLVYVWSLGFEMDHWLDG